MASVHTENFYRAFFEHSMEAMLLTAPDGAIFAANPAACELFGLTEEEICNAGRSGLVDESSPQLNDLRAERARTGRARGELVFIHGDGTRFPGAISSAQFTDTEGNIRTVMIVRDLSETQRNELALAQSLYEANKNAAEVEAILASHDDAILMFDMGMNVRRVNPSFAKIYGFDPVGLNNKEILQRVSCQKLDGGPLVFSDLPTVRALREGEVSSGLYTGKRGDGSAGIVEATSRPLYVNGVIVGSVTVWHDITEAKHAEERLKKSSEEIEDLYQHAPCGYHSLDENGFFTRMNDTELEWLGCRRDEVIGKMRFSDLLAPGSLHTFQKNFSRFKELGYVHDLEYEINRKDGTVFPILLNSTAIRDAAGRYVASRGTVFDMTARKVLESELARQARIDMLTGLNNRRHFFELAEQALARAKRHGDPLSLLMLDLDNFKSVNDSYGHHIGDATLQKLSEVCLRTLRGIDIIGRIGGEEFAVLLPRTTRELALEVAERLRLAVESILVTLEGDAPFHFTISIGVSSFSNATDATIDILLKCADAALYKAKNAGRNQVCSECSQDGKQPSS
ncbi:MAG: diguanylate cyclase [Burkholderiales bacterium]